MRLPSGDQAAEHQSAQRPQQRRPVRALAEQHGDQGNGPQVVDDGQGQQEDPQRRRQALADEAEDGQRKGDVGR